MLFAAVHESGLVTRSGRFPLEEVHRAISGLQSRNGGFSNYVICREARQRLETDGALAYHRRSVRLR